MYGSTTDGTGNLDRLDYLEKEQQLVMLMATSGNGAATLQGEVSTVHPTSSEFTFPLSSIATPASSHVPAYLDLFLSFSETTAVSKTLYN